MAKSICSLQMTSKLNLHGNTVLANPDKLILTLTSWTGYKREILYLHQEPVTANITEHNEASPEKNGLVQSIQRLVSISWKQNFSKSGHRTLLSPSLFLMPTWKQPSFRFGGNPALLLEISARSERYDVRKRNVEKMWRPFMHINGLCHFFCEKLFLYMQEGVTGAVCPNLPDFHLSIHPRFLSHLLKKLINSLQMNWLQSFSLL